MALAVRAELAHHRADDVRAQRARAERRALADGGEERADELRPAKQQRKGLVRVGG